MLQLFQKSFSFAFQELTSRSWFWYKIYLIFMTLLVGASMLFGAVLLGLFTAVFMIKSYIDSIAHLFSPNYITALIALIWLLAGAIMVMSTFYFVKKTMSLGMGFLATALACAHDEKTTKLIFVTNVYPFIGLLCALMIPGILIMLGQTLITLHTGSKIIGALFCSIMSLYLAARFYFAWFVLLENENSKASALQLVVTSLKQSLRVTRGKFKQIFLINLVSQFFSCIGLLLAAFDINSTFSSQAGMFISILLFLSAMLLFPLSVLIQARAYVLLQRG